MMATAGKRRVAVVGTGHRGAGTWERELLANCGDVIDLVGLCDSNALRLQRARQAIGVDCPIFTDLGAMLAARPPDTLVVCTRDSAHDDHIVAALEAGVDAITEKPMATTAEKCARILEAERRTGRRVDVAFNYRFAPTARAVKRLLRAGTIGDVASADFHWYLDVQHGTDYFRRWHAERASSGNLFVHKATHHFDLLNWYRFLPSAARDAGAGEVDGHPTDVLDVAAEVRGRSRATRASARTSGTCCGEAETRRLVGRMAVTR
jgi:predicted dehydrogenase